MPAKVKTYYDQSSGVTIRFRTDATEFRVNWTLEYNSYEWTNTTPLAQYGIDLYCRTRHGWRYVGCGQPILHQSRQQQQIIDHMETGTKEFVLYLPLNACVSAVEFCIPHSSTLEFISSTDKCKVDFFGSSITHGVGVSSPGMALPARLARTLDIEIANFGVDSLFKLEPFFASIIIDSTADALIFDAFSNPDSEQIASRLETFISAIRKHHRYKPLIFLQTLRRETTNYNSRIRTYESDKINTASRIMNELIKEDKNLYFINPGLTIGEDSLGTVDGIHPNDLGHERIIQNIAPQIKAILKSYNLLN